MPPVIERAAQERVDRYAAIARDQGRIVARVAGVPEHGWFCPPTVAADLPPDSPVLNEEIFGPLLAIERVKNVEHACDIVDGLPFALTGGLFARDPATVRYVRERTPVGNLYVNRGITGAMVGRQPFGGNRLSGTGSKAGGPDYLLPVRRAARRDREHDAPRARGLRRPDTPEIRGDKSTLAALPRGEYGFSHPWCGQPHSRRTRAVECRLIRGARTLRMARNLLTGVDLSARAVDHRHRHAAAALSRVEAVAGAGAGRRDRAQRVSPGRRRARCPAASCAGWYSRR